MKKTHMMIILSIILVLAGIYYFGFNFIYRSSCNELMEQQLKVARYQSELVANLLSDELDKGTPKIEVIDHLQQALEKSSTDPVFICMFNKAGKEICHPDRKNVGYVVPEGSSIKSFSNISLEENFRAVLSKSVAYGGMHTIEGRTEVIYLSPVKNTDWIIASHSNVASLENTLIDIKTKLQLFFILTWVCSVALILFLINLLYQRYFSKITNENLKIQNQVMEVQMTEGQSENIQKKENLPTVKRFLAEKGLKLVPIEVENIAFVYLENKVVYIVDYKGDKLTLDTSLEDIYQTLPKEQFFRVSRQIILSLKAIQNIEKYGLTQLRAITDPSSEIPIIISKAKVSEFKIWMGK